MKKVDEIKKIAQKCLKCKKPNCVNHCPLANDIPHILEEIVHNNIDYAKHILLESTYSSIICSKLCDFKRSCYGGCILNNSKGGAVPFYEVEAYLSSQIKTSDFKQKKIVNPKKIAIVGAGISGITASILFQMNGHLVTLFEKNNKIGGVLSDSLPDFRFDCSVIKHYEDILHSLGVNICFGKEYGNNLSINELAQYDVILFAMGTMDSKRLFSEENANIVDAMDILRKAKQKENYLNHHNVVVIGGGNVAMDVARTLVRNQNNVTIVYRRDLMNAPASQKEIEDALAENVIFKPLLAPIQPIYKNEELVGLEVEVTKIVEKDDGNRKLFVGTGKKEIVICDAIVEAIGLNARYSYLKKDIPTFFDDNGWIKQEGVIQLNNQIIASCGDYFTGASTFAKTSKNTLQQVHKILEMIK